MNILRVKSMSNGRWGVYAAKRCITKGLITKHDAQLCADAHWERMSEQDRAILHGTIQYVLEGVLLSYNEALYLLRDKPKLLVRLVKEGVI